MGQRQAKGQESWVQPFEKVVSKGFFIFFAAIFFAAQRKGSAPAGANDRKKEKTMKNGVIVYVAGQAPADWTEERDLSLREAAAGAEAVELITSRSGHFDVADAWHALTVRGMNHIVCKSAVFDEAGRLRFTGKEMRLCG
jgi:hypothetical protein